MFAITNIREMQIKPTNYDFTPVRMVIIKRQGLTNVGEDVEKRNPLTLLEGL